MWFYQKLWKEASAKGRRIQGSAVLEISSGRSSVAGASAQQLSAGFVCQLAKQEVITGQTTSTSSLGTGQGTCYHSGDVGDGREVTVLWEDKGMGEHAVLWEAIKAIGNVVRIWDGWWGGGVEQEYRTPFHSKLGFINDAALRTACFLTCKESVKCCLFFSQTFLLITVFFSLLPSHAVTLILCSESQHILCCFIFWNVFKSALI